MGVDISGSYDTEAKPSQFDRLPAGTYKAKIIEAEVVEISETEDKGRALKLTWQIMDGEFDGRLFWQRLLMWFTGAEKTPGKVVEIANQQFAAVREATVGLGKVVKDTDEILHIPASLTVGPQKNDDRYDEVKSVKPLGGGAGGGAGFAPGPSRSGPPASNQGGGSLPWKKAG
jgi:hypothetical protein